MYYSFERCIHSPKITQQVSSKDLNTSCVQLIVRELNLCTGLDGLIYMPCVCICICVCVCIYIYIYIYIYIHVYVYCCFCLLLSQVQLFCNPMDCSLPGSSVNGISQASTLEWVAISFSRESSQPRDQTHGSCIAGIFFTAEPPGKPTTKTINID